MKTKKSARKWLPLATAACLCCALSLPAQTPPTITTQPISQTNLAGSTVTFTVAVSGTGPFTYQWQFKGTNLPNTNFLIATVAGTNNAGYSGDGGAAINASLDYPKGAVMDAGGNLYIADSGNNRVRKVDTNGIITTFAGTNSSGYSGDGGAAINARLYSPFGVACDSAGNLYIADTSNNRIRKVGTNGIITTVAGTNSGGYSGDGGAAVNARLYTPFGVAVDSLGNLYIADDSNNRIRKVDTNGIITTFAGTNAAGYAGDGGAAVNANLRGPWGVVEDALGDLYIGDELNHRIRKVDTNGIITTVAGTNSAGYSGDGGAAVNAELFWPAGVDLDAFGNLYIADGYNDCIRKVSTNGIINTIAAGAMNNPIGVAFDALGNLYIADSGNCRIREVFFAGAPTLPLTNVSAYNAGSYTVVISNVYGCVTSGVATLTVQAPPVITVQPTNQTVLPGASPVFSAAVVGSGPFGYLLYLAGTNLVQSGTNSGLALPGVSAINAGNYTVVVTNAWGGATSQVAVLTVMAPPIVTAQAGSQAVLPGTNVAFSVTAAGSGPLICQWQFNGANIPNYVITTVAGNGYELYGEGGFSGDGGAATNAELFWPFGVAIDGAGNLYFADNENERIRRVGTNGVITTVAGNGTLGYSGDGGAATNAHLYLPRGVASDPAGNLYIADFYNNRIRKVGTNGVITTVAGTNSAGYSGDGGAATNARLNVPSGVALDAFGNLYIADMSNNCIRMVGANGIISTVAGTNSAGYSGDGGAAVNASLWMPVGVAVDCLGNLYIADEYNNRIRAVNTSGIITTVAGNGALGYSGDGGAAAGASLTLPAGVAVDATGNLYIIDGYNSRIREVSTSGIITTIAGMGGSGYSGDGGPATGALLYGPAGLAVDSAGNVYIADTDNNRIRKASPASSSTFTLTNVSSVNAGSYTAVIGNAYGSVTSAVATLTVQAPPVVTVQPAGQIALPGSSAVFPVSAAGAGPFGYSWYLDSTNLVQSGLNSALMLADISTNDAGNYTVVVTNAYGSVTSQVAILTIAFPASVTGLLGSQTVLTGTNVSLTAAAGGTGPFSYQWQLNGTNLPNDIISTVAGTNGSGYSGDGGPAPKATLYYPYGVAVDASGNIYIADSYNQRIRKVAANGTITTVAGTNGSGYSGDGGAAINSMLNCAWGVAVDSSGNLYIADTWNSRIRKVATSGIITTVAGGGYGGDGSVAIKASLSYPEGAAVDSLGNLYIADSGNNRIRKVDTNGIITTVAGTNSAGYSGDGGMARNASLSSPQSVACDSAGNLYIGDEGNNRIRKVDFNGIITTLAGNGTAAFAGDGGNATNASLQSPMGVALDAAGNLFIADNYNNRIREVYLAGFPTLALTNVSTKNAGNYTVVVSSPYGSVTSAVATVNVALSAPQIITGDGYCGFLTNQFGFNLSGPSGQTIVVDGSADLVNWTPLFTNTCGGGNPFYFCDPCWTNFAWRFYRARLQ